MSPDNDKELENEARGMQGARTIALTRRGRNRRGWWLERSPGVHVKQKAISSDSTVGRGFGAPRDGHRVGVPDTKRLRGPHCARRRPADYSSEGSVTPDYPPSKPRAAAMQTRIRECVTPLKIIVDSPHLKRSAGAIKPSLPLVGPPRVGANVAVPLIIHSPHCGRYAGASSRDTAVGGRA